MEQTTLEDVEDIPEPIYVPNSPAAFAPTLQIQTEPSTTVKSSLPGEEWDELDNQIIKAIEEVLDVDIPVDSKLLYRDSSPRYTRNGLSDPDYGSLRRDFEVRRLEPKLFPLHFFSGHFARVPNERNGVLFHKQRNPQAKFSFLTSKKEC